MRVRNVAVCVWRERLVGALLVSTLLAPAMASQPSESGFQIRHATTRLVDGYFQLDADVDFAFSEQSREAMVNGVPLTVLLEIEVLRKRDTFWNQPVAKQQLRFRIETHALTKHYVVRSLASGETRNFRTFSEMQASLGEIVNVPVIAAYLLDTAYEYLGRIRARLDIEALPSPLRPLAYLSRQWRHTSDWYSWPLVR